ncbi:MAG TPA: lysozyme, partial [Candidatus Nanoarchaeia archaeon]|nr:lysozyme [Candidatus Nanoarchaeia archaeon]
NYSGAAQEFDRWVYAGGKKVKGLQNRRAREKALFLSDK